MQQLHSNTVHRFKVMFSLIALIAISVWALAFAPGANAQNIAGTYTIKNTWRFTLTATGGGTYSALAEISVGGSWTSCGSVNVDDSSGYYGGGARGQVRYSDPTPASTKTAELHVGTANADTITVDADRFSLVFGLAEDDIIAPSSVSGSNEPLMIFGGDNADTITGGANDDELYGDDGNDTIEGGDGDDFLAGMDGNDTIYGDSTNTSAGSGNDIILGGQGDNYVYGCGGDDAIQCGSGDDHIWGNDGDDLIWGDYTPSSVQGGVDTIHGNDGDDAIYGQSGNDVLYGDDGNDTIYGDEPSASYTFPSTLDTISGGNGTDDLFGGTGDDPIHGDAGDDLIRGDTGGDTLDGDGGDDCLDGGPGVDALDGGDGTNFVHDRDTTSSDTLVGGSGNGLNSNRLGGLNGLQDNMIMADDGAADTVTRTSGSNNIIWFDVGGGGADTLGGAGTTSQANPSRASVVPAYDSSTGDKFLDGAVFDFWIDGWAGPRE